MSKPQIVVGIDGSRTAELAMAWAASEAGLRNASLLIAHAGDVDSMAGSAAPTEYGRALMADAQATVYDSDANCEVSTLLSAEEPTQLLTRLSEQAELVVVGSHGLGRASGAILGSVAYRVAGHAHCPVAIVPTGWATPKAAQRSVVVGVSALPAGLSVLNYAFTEAGRRGVAVTAVRSWHRADWNPQLPEVLYDAGDRFEDRQAERAELILRPVRDAHPDVEVVTVVTGKPIEDALLSAAQNAELLILGTRAADGRRLSRLGRTSSRLAHQSPCPVIVVGHQRLTSSPATGLKAPGSLTADLQSKR